MECLFNHLDYAFLLCSILHFPHKLMIFFSCILPSHYSIWKHFALGSKLTITAHRNLFDTLERVAGLIGKCDDRFFWEVHRMHHLYSCIYFILFLINRSDKIINRELVTKLNITQWLKVLLGFVLIKYISHVARWLKA